jgi:hypothetical protein
MLPAIVQTFSTWLKTTTLSWIVIRYPWVWPAAETLHFIRLAMLIGLPFAPLHRLLPWAIAGFLVCLSTGSVFFAGDPFQYIHNPVFWFKMLLILLAGINALVFYLTGIFTMSNDYNRATMHLFQPNSSQQFRWCLDRRDVSRPYAALPRRGLLNLSTSQPFSGTRCL